MSEPHIEGEDQEENEAVFNRIWKNEDAFYERYRLKRHQHRARRKIMNEACYRPDRRDKEK